ncbi:secreted in xylem 6-like protein [Colletotrichum incanum]|nr:secreted in xylem 6-like protein [Colletotrichum incanum]
MKLVLIATIFAASCKAGLIAQAEEADETLPKFTINHVDVAPADFEPLNANLTDLASRDTLPVSNCPAGQTYDRSVCYKSNIIRSFCIANPRSNREKITDTPCAAHEVCVQRLLSTGKSYAKCIPIVDLVSWKTSPAGDKEGCTSTTVSTGGTHHLGTIVYDRNSNPIQVDKIRYLGEPGNVDEGIGGSVSSFSSNLFSFTGGRYIKACIFSGGFGNLNAYTWSWE